MRTPNFTERLARAGARRRRLVLGGWGLAVLVAAGMIAGLLGSALTTDDDFTGMPESQQARQVLRDAFPPERAIASASDVDEAVIVSSSSSAASAAGPRAGDPRFAARLRTLAAQLRAAGAARVVRG